LGAQKTVRFCGGKIAANLTLRKPYTICMSHKRRNKTWERESALPFEEPIEFVCALTAFSCQLALVEVRRHFFRSLKTTTKIVSSKKKKLCFFLCYRFL
jgi:hypothetical protein